MTTFTSNWNSLGDMIYGGDYNPDHWPEEVWKEDVQLMQQAGVNLVSLGIFSWAKLNPAPGVFTFDWFDRVMELLHQGNIKVNLATATASPPAWLWKLHPEIGAIDKDGTPYAHGGRQCYTPNSPAFITHALALTQALADRYKDHPALVMWHVNNELHGNGPESYGEEDAKAFRIWLQKRYGDLDGLNRAWGTSFWSQIYGDWNEVIPPRKLTTGPNPSADLDYKRFFSDTYIDFYNREAAILRKATPHIPVTTNLMNLYPKVDQFKIIENCDLAAYDCYPNPNGKPGEFLAVSADLTRSLTPDKPWLLMEQVTSQVNWQPPNSIKSPGVMRLWSLSHIARGSDGVMFFQWRQGRFGSEKFHGAMVPNSGADGRVFQEVCELGADFKKLKPVVGSTLSTEIGICWNWENIWALETSDKPQVFNHNEEIQRLHEACRDLGLTTNFVHPSNPDLSRYKVLILPCTYMLTREQGTAITEFVNQGGQLLTTYFSGLVDIQEHLHPGKAPLPLRDVLGLWVEECDALAHGATNQMVFNDGTTLPCDYICETVKTEGADILATYQSHWYAGQPALTRHRYGSGTACYLATRPATRESWAGVLQRVIDVPAFSHGYELNTGVDILTRIGSDGTRYTFFLNYNPESVSVSLGKTRGQDLLTGHTVSDILPLESYGVCVLEES
jgi:beta-galactosidase